MKYYRISVNKNRVRVVEQKFVSESAKTVILNNSRIKRSELNILGRGHFRDDYFACLFYGYCDSDHLQECIDGIPALVSDWVSKQRERICEMNAYLDDISGEMVVVEEGSDE